MDTLREHLGEQLVCAGAGGVAECLFFNEEATIMKPQVRLFLPQEGTPSMNGTVLDADFTMQTARENAL